MRAASQASATARGGTARATSWQRLRIVGGKASGAAAGEHEARIARRLLERLQQVLAAMVHALGRVNARPPCRDRAPRSSWRRRPRRASPRRGCPCSACFLRRRRRRPRRRRRGPAERLAQRLGHEHQQVGVRARRTRWQLAQCAAGRRSGARPRTARPAPGRARARTGRRPRAVDQQAWPRACASACAQRLAQPGQRHAGRRRRPRSPPRAPSAALDLRARPASRVAGSRIDAHEARAAPRGARA